MVEVVTPEEYTGGIIGDLTSPPARIQGQDTRGNAIGCQIAGSVPLANMFGYINYLRPCPPAARSSRCSSTITSRCRRTSRKRCRSKYAITPGVAGANPHTRPSTSP